MLIPCFTKAFEMRYPVLKVTYSLYAQLLPWQRTHHLILSEHVAPLIVLHVRSNSTLLNEDAKSLKFRHFLNFDYTKTAKMPEGPFCQIRAHLLL